VGRRQRLIGATVEDAGFDERVTVAGVERCSKAPWHCFQARGLRHSTARAPACATSDELPIIGRSSTMRGVYCATGYRNGVLWRRCLRR
jgi:glycine/D-amino acid oxidase-like deaminating enzyme